jgi:thioredoxin-dependent peroxiredoxin
MADLLNLNGLAPDFKLPASNGELISLSQYRGRQMVLVFFYPGDFTPVCTLEVSAFRDDYEKFTSRGVTLLGISPDSIEKHRRFAAECNVPFLLLSDKKLDVARQYGAKGMLGMRRAYYLIDLEGKLVWQHAEWLPIFKLSNEKIFHVIDGLGTVNQSASTA